MTVHTIHDYASCVGVCLLKKRKKEKELSVNGSIWWIFLFNVTEVGFRFWRSATLNQKQQWIANVACDCRQSFTPHIFKSMSISSFSPKLCHSNGIVSDPFSFNRYANKHACHVTMALCTDWQLFVYSVTTHLKGFSLSPGILVFVWGVWHMDTIDTYRVLLLKQDQLIAA